MIFRKSWGAGSIAPPLAILCLVPAWSQGLHVVAQPGYICNIVQTATIGRRGPPDIWGQSPLSRRHPAAWAFTRPDNAMMSIVLQMHPKDG
eukprot:358002-Chlamydomonas_euryale.AAC.2